MVVPMIIPHVEININLLRPKQHRWKAVFFVLDLAWSSPNFAAFRTQTYVGNSQTSREPPWKISNPRVFIGKIDHHLTPLCTGVSLWLETHLRATSSYRDSATETGCFTRWNHPKHWDSPWKNDESDSWRFCSGSLRTAKVMKPWPSAMIYITAAMKMTRGYMDHQEIRDVHPSGP